MFKTENNVLPFVLIKKKAIWLKPVSCFLQSFINENKYSSSPISSLEFRMVISSAYNIVLDFTDNDNGTSFI